MTVTATGTGTGTPVSFARMKSDISMARPTISAHRLWTSLWMFLGQPLDNSPWRVGNQRVNESDPGGTHTAAPQKRPNTTAAVGTGTRAGLREARFSPASTVPMTTTEP